MCSRALIIIMVTSVLEIGTAQEKAVKLSGSVSLSSEQYVSSGIPARRPGGVSRAILRPTVSFYDQIVLPFEIYYSTQEKGFRQPFNQFGVSPRLWGWLTLHAGYFSSRVSELTFGDTRLLGGGVEVKTSTFRFAFLYGRSQQSISPDSSRGVRGEFKRMALATRIGLGNEGGFFFDVNFLRAWDDARSVQVSSAILTPRENAVLSLGTGMPLLNGAVHFNVEAGISAFSYDTRSPELKKIPRWVKSIFTPRYSSQIDGAIRSSLKIVFSHHFSMNLSGRWIGPGYVTLGYAQLPSDVFEWTVGPVARLLESKLILRASVGMRVNNLRNDRLASTRRLIINTGVTVQPSTTFGVDGQYMNFGMRSRPRLDSLRIENVTRSLSVSPRYSFASFGGSNTIAMTYSQQSFTDLSTASNRAASNSVHSGSSVWTLTFPSSLSVTTSISYTFARTQALKSKVTSLNGTVGHTFLNNMLQTSISIGYSTNKTVSQDAQLHGNVRASYILAMYGSFTLTLSTYGYDYGTTGVPSYRELFGSLQYAYSL